MNLLDIEEFEHWIKASHKIFEIFEGRYDVYPLATLWAHQWLNSEIFIVQNEHIARINNLLNNFNYKAFGIEENQAKEIGEQFRRLIKEFLPIGKNENIGFAIAPYLFTWNFQRFKKYFETKLDYKLDAYFKELGDFLKEKRQEIKFFQDKKLLYDKVEQDKIKSLFDSLNIKLKNLGISQNEPIGTVKILHIFSPYYFPLIDNEIADVFKLKRHHKETLSSSHYLQWMKYIKLWLLHYNKDRIEKLEKEFQCSILKLVDQALYIICSVNLKNRIGRIALEVV